MSTAEYATEYVATRASVSVSAASGDFTGLDPPPTPVPPGPHGWRLCAATATSWEVNVHTQRVLYTWFWKRTGRERIVGALGGDGGDP